MDGFCNEEVKPLGPVQLQEVALVAVPNKFNVPPTQTGLLVFAVTTEGTAVFTITDAVLAAAAAPQTLLAVSV